MEIEFDEELLHGLPESVTIRVPDDATEEEIVAALSEDLRRRGLIE